MAEQKESNEELVSNLANQPRVFISYARADASDIIKRINVGGSKDPGVAASKKICEEAIEVTSKLAITNGGDRSAEQRFWELYYGEMNLLELRQKTKSYSGDAGGLATSSIELAMVAFKNTLTAIKSGEDSIPPTISLQQLAQKVNTECDAFLKQRD